MNTKSLGETYVDQSSEACATTYRLGIAAGEDRKNTIRDCLRNEDNKSKSLITSDKVDGWKKQLEQHEDEDRRVNGIRIIGAASTTQPITIKGQEYYQFNRYNIQKSDAGSFRVTKEVCRVARS